jgi:hypothetical protein
VRRARGPADTPLPRKGPGLTAGGRGRRSLLYPAGRGNPPCRPRGWSHPDVVDNSRKFQRFFSLRHVRHFQRLFDTPVDVTKARNAPDLGTGSCPPSPRCGKRLRTRRGSNSLDLAGMHVRCGEGVAQQVDYVYAVLADDPRTEAVLLEDEYHQAVVLNAVGDYSPRIGGGFREKLGGPTEPPPQGSPESQARAPRRGRTAARTSHPPHRQGPVLL